MQNFGEIKNHFNSLLSEGITTKDEKKKKLFKEYVKEIKNDKILKAQFLVYTSIEKKAEMNEAKATEFVKANIEALQKYSKKQIIEANNKLASKFGEGKFTNELAQLHEDITTLIFTEKTPKNVDNRIEALSGVVDYIKENITKEESGEVNILPNSTLATIAVDKFNDRYEDLNEDEKSVLRTIIESDDDGKSEIFKSLSKDCINLVNENLKGSDVDTKEKLLEVKDRILNMEYTSDSFITNISKLIELKGNLSE